jgi:eukaryotic-like serine/threonine-protein kinase
VTIVSDDAPPPLPLRPFPSDPEIRRDSGDVPTLVNPGRASVLPAVPDQKERYQARQELGKGGMGIVRLCLDTRIGRDVAMKVLRPEQRNKPDLAARFLREARVQGQLEHPSVVPVYDVGVDKDGAVFFTMKCLRGMTLSQVLRGLRSRDPAMTQTYSRRKLLTIFSSLCLAIEYAHSRGVLHRDLKPANVMLGDFGEVYALDWGIAKILDPAAAPPPAEAGPKRASTMPGEVLGTPGYISPEAAWGKSELIDARADVYALGCILFEMLTLQPLHGRAASFDVLRAVMDDVDARAGVRDPERDIPPELDEICVKATAAKPKKRYPSVRALHDAVERFLDGDRDMEMRRDLAAEHAQRAEWAISAALSGEGAAAEKSRREALREAGRALALDPDNERAFGALQKVFTAPPREMPAEVSAELDATERRRHRIQIRVGLIVDLVGIVGAIPLALLTHVRDMTFVAALVALLAISAAIKLYAYRSVGVRSIDPLAFAAFLLDALAVSTLSRVWGPIFVMPVLLVLFANGYMLVSWRRYQYAIIATTIAVQLCATLVEMLGLLPRVYSFSDGALSILPRSVVHGPVPTLVGLTVFAILTLLVPMNLTNRILAVLREAEQRAVLQSWQLRQLLPPRARTVPPPASSVTALSPRHNKKKS